MTLTALCKEVNNYFDSERLYGTYTIRDGAFTQGLPLLEGQYFAVFDSVFNDGVHKFGDTDLTDETFTGSIWALKIPKEFVALCKDITDWETANAAALNSPYNSESFGGYSYSKASGNNGKSLSYADVGKFASAMNRWRKICPY